MSAESKISVKRFGPRQVLLLMGNRSHEGDLPFPAGRGGARNGAGRPKKSRETVPHARRAPLSRRHPVHVTLRVARGLPPLRRGPTYSLLRGALAAGSERFGFRLNHFAVMNDHFHLIVEADDRRALTRGLKGLAVRMARAVNRVWKRKGRVFAERYHEHVLRTPREVRHALCYVLNNARKHGLWFRKEVLDPFTSGAWFDGWRLGQARAFEGNREARFPSALLELPIARARTWLMTVGWRRHGLVGIGEIPGGPSGRRGASGKHR